MHSTGEYVHILRKAVDKLARAYSRKWLHWNNFLRSKLSGFSSFERTCLAIFFLRRPNEDVTSKPLYRSKSTNYQPR